METNVAYVGKNSDGWYCFDRKYSEKYLTKDKIFKEYESSKNNDYYFELKDILNILKELGRDVECLYGSNKAEYDMVMAELLAFKKSDLKNGDIVINRSEEVYIVLDSFIRGPDGFDDLGNYKENLTSSYNNLDIMKVYRPQNTLRGLVLEPFNPGCAKLVYERETKPDIKIGEYKVSFNDDGIKVGCKIISKEEIKTIHEGLGVKYTPAPKLQGGDVVVIMDRFKVEKIAYQLCGDRFVGRYGWNETSLYDDDLMNTENMPEYDIMEVYRATLKQGEFRLNPFNQGSMDKIWSRDNILWMSGFTIVFANDHIIVDEYKIPSSVVKQIYDVFWGESE